MARAGFKWIVGAVALAALAAGAGAAFWYAQTSSGGAADAGNRTQVAAGAVVYKEHCAVCHGASLEGQPNWRSRRPDGRLPAPPHDETGHTWHHPDAQLFRITALGMKPPLAPAGYESDMPGFKGILTDDEIWAVLAFIKSKWPAAIQARHRDISERAAR